MPRRQLDIDDKANVPLAKRFNVLKEGIPNVKLFNAGESAVAVLTGDIEPAADIAPRLSALLKKHGAYDDAGFLKAGARHEEL